MRVGIIPCILSLIFTVFWMGSAAQETTLKKLQDAWLSAFNGNTLERSILDVYVSNPVADYGDGFSVGKMDVYLSLVNFRSEAGILTEAEQFGGTTDTRNNYLETGWMKGNENKTAYAYVTAWRNSGGNYNKEFEMVFAGAGKGKIPHEAIAEKRRQWETFSNNHDPGQLVSEVYTPNAVYVNNGEVTRGRTQIARRYDYMSSPSWKISLTALHLLRVSDELVIELGKYVSSGEGRYVLIWKKQKDGEWLAELDFNF